MSTVGVELAHLAEEEFGVRLRAAVGELQLTDAVVRRLFRHYEQLRLWSSRQALIGRGTAHEVIERHYAESLTALPLLGSCARLVDVGSGAGFPGWVLAAARPDIEAWLIESNRRKASFLRAAAHKAALACRVLDARVAALLPLEFPRSIDVVTVRAVRMSASEWKALGHRIAADGRVLRWVGPLLPPAPAGWVATGRVPFSASRRTVEELVRREAIEGGR